MARKTSERADAAAGDDSPVVYRFVGPLDADGRPLLFIYGVPARDLTEADLAGRVLVGEPVLDADGRPTGETKDVTEKTLKNSALYEKAEGKRGE